MSCAEMTSLPLALAGEGLQRPGQRRAQDGQLAAELGRALDDLEQVGQPQHVGERHAPRQAQAPPERARGRDVAGGQLLAHRHLVAPAAGHRRAHHGDIHAAALHLRPHALAQVALPGRILAGQRDPDVEVALVDAPDLDHDARRGGLARCGAEAGHAAHRA